MNNLFSFFVSLQKAFYYACVSLFFIVQFPQLIIAQEKPLSNSSIEEKKLLNINLFKFLNGIRKNDSTVEENNFAPNENANPVNILPIINNSPINDIEVKDIFVNKNILDEQEIYSNKINKHITYVEDAVEKTEKETKLQKIKVEVQKNNIIEDNNTKNIKPKLTRKRTKIIPSLKVDSKTINPKDELENVKSILARQKYKQDNVKVKRININRVNKDNSEKQKEINLKVNKKSSNKIKFDKQRTLNKAHKALLAGQLLASANIYKSVLKREPKNKDALLGLATAYHKNLQFDRARSIYNDLLKIDPENKEALNNFVTLSSDKSPSHAIENLKELQKISPKFAPIAAQLGILHMQIGDYVKAERFLRRAVALDSQNTSYKYNLAIVSDHQGKFKQAIDYYMLVLKDVKQGANIEASIDSILSRVRFLKRG